MLRLYHEIESLEVASLVDLEETTLPDTNLKVTGTIHDLFPSSAKYPTLAALRNGHQLVDPDIFERALPELKELALEVVRPMPFPDPHYLVDEAVAFIFRKFTGHDCKNHTVYTYSRPSDWKVDQPDDSVPYIRKAIRNYVIKITQRLESRQRGAGWNEETADEGSQGDPFGNIIKSVSTPSPHQTILDGVIHDEEQRRVENAWQELPPNIQSIALSWLVPKLRNSLFNAAIHLDPKPPELFGLVLNYVYGDMNRAFQVLNDVINNSLNSLPEKDRSIIQKTLLGEIPPSQLGIEGSRPHVRVMVCRARNKLVKNIHNQIMSLR